MQKLPTLPLLLAVVLFVSCIEQTYHKTKQVSVNTQALTTGQPTTTQQPNKLN